MTAAFDPSLGVVAAALVTAFGVLGAAAISGWYSRKNNRAIGKPNGQGTLVQMTEHLISQVANINIEASVTRGMVEELGSQLHAHTQEDLQHFETLHDEVRKVTDADLADPTL